MEASLELLKYPVGRFDCSKDYSDSAVHHAIEMIRLFPDRIRNLVGPLNADQQDVPYRPGGWNTRQVIHHCADSHMNAYIRFKLALTEDQPTIKPYDQDAWAKLADSELEVSVSLKIIDGVHKRWTAILENMSASDWKRVYFHPEFSFPQELNKVACMYGWHCEHHYGHIAGLVERMGWS
jgi:hypothetical protein